MCQTCRTRFDGGQPEGHCPRCGAPQGKNAYLNWELRAYVHGEAVGAEAKIEYRLAKIGPKEVTSTTMFTPAALIESLGVQTAFFLAWKMLTAEAERVEFINVYGSERV